MSGKRILDVSRGVLLSLLVSYSAVCGAETFRLSNDMRIYDTTPNYDGLDIIVPADRVLTIDGTHEFNSLKIEKGGTLTSRQLEARYREWPRSSRSQDGMVLTIWTDMTIEEGAFVDVSGTGHESNKGGNNGVGAGSKGIPSGGGGGHGGRGGDGDAAGGAAYDSKDKPSEVGGGGGNGGDYPLGGYGGGRVSISVRGKLLLNGEIHADGRDGQAEAGYISDVVDPANYIPLFGGGGAGGAIYLNVWTLSGSGLITADGGSSGRYGKPAVTKGGGGGGGRIAVYYGDPNSEFGGAIWADGGGGGQPGEDGTIVVKGREPFTVGIESPAPEAKRVEGKRIRFKAADTYGLRPFTYTWSSDRDGPLGVGASLEVSTLSAGTHTITLSGADASGATSLATIIVVVVPAKYAYRATVRTDLDRAYAGTPVVMTGQASWVDDTPAAGVEVAIRVRNEGMERTITVRTDESGGFSTDWQPFDTEAGRYSISADRPDVTDEPAEDEFLLFGATIEPNAVDYRIVAGQRIDRSVPMQNLGDIELSGLSVRVENAPANLRVEPNCPKILGPKAATALKYSITAVDASVQDAHFDLVVSHEQTAVATLHAHAEVVPPWAVLEARPREITAGMVQGAQALVDFEIANVGGLRSDATTIRLPANAAWMSLVTSDTIDALEPNESTVVTLSLRPEPAMPLGPYDGNLAVGDGQAEATVPFRYDCVSAAVGSLTVTAADEFTFYAAGNPGVAGAHVTVTDAQTGQVIGSVDANDAGAAEFSDLPDAYYNIEVTTDDHEAFRTVLRVSAGSHAQLTAFLPRKLVTYRWTIPAGAAAGHGDFKVEADSATDAPVPVVTVEPLLLELCDLPQEGAQVTYTFTNHGLLAARNVRLDFRDFAGFEFIPLVDTIDLPAGESVEVPVRVHNSNISAGVPGPCNDCDQSALGVHELSYRLRCGQEDLLYKTPFFAKAFAGVCSPPRHGRDIVGSSPGVAAIGGGPVDQVIPYPSCDARVRMQIDQKTVLAGDAFSATLELENRTLALDSIRLVLAICDDEGTPSEYLFDIQPPQVNGINDLSGTGSLSAGQALTAQWLIAAAPHAACGEPRRYEISAELTYMVGGVSTRMSLYPASIAVLPKPQLEVKYFLERDIQGDDLLTDAAEPATPFSLAMMVTNRGCSAAGDVQIVSAQPRIINDVQGGPIDFKIIATRIGRDDVSPVLNARLGEIQPDTHMVVHWLMQSSLQGWFENYRAGFMHTDGLGDKRLAAVGEPPIYELSHVVRVGYPDDDGVPDFLTNSPETHLPDAIHLSDGSVHPVAAIPHTLSEIAVLGSHVYLTVPDLPADYFYVRFSDPSLSQSPLMAVTRSDGVALPIGENVWTTQRLVRTEGQPASEETLLHLFDRGGSGAYILDYANLPPLKVEVKYFLERRIYGDDSVTKDVEPAVPFSLAVIVRNQGYATAKDVWLIASPPQIVDYANQRLPDPNVVGVTVGSNDVAPSLQIKIGDLEVDESKVIRWVMQSSLQGKLESWNVEFVQVDDLGGRYPLDVSSVSVHELEHAVRATWSDDDGACDFLTRESPSTYGLADTLYLSDGSVWPAPVTGLVRMVHELVRIREHLQIRLAVVGVPDGPFYVRYPDPTEGKLKLVAVTRSDGVSIPVDTNAWTTRRTVREPPWQPFEENFLHLFDYGGPGSYTFEYELGDWKSFPPDEP